MFRPIAFHLVQDSFCGYVIMSWILDLLFRWELVDWFGML